MENKANYSVTKKVEHISHYNLTRNIENITNYSVTIVKKRKKIYTLRKETKLNSQ